FTELLADESVATAYRAAHEQFLADRAGFGEVDEIVGISSGGMPERVKCLHALAAHALAAGPGVNPIGDATLERSAWTPQRCECQDPGAARAEPTDDSGVAK